MELVFLGYFIAVPITAGGYSILHHDVISAIGGQATLNCGAVSAQSTVKWSQFPLGMESTNSQTNEIYVNGLISASNLHRYMLIRRQFNLVLLAVELRDAGSYVCHATGSSETYATTEVIVIRQEVTCVISDDASALQCFVEYAGNKKLNVVWSAQTGAGQFSLSHSEVTAKQSNDKDAPATDAKLAECCCSFSLQYGGGHADERDFSVPRSNARMECNTTGDTVSFPMTASFVTRGVTPESTAGRTLKLTVSNNISAKRSLGDNTTESSVAAPNDQNNQTLDVPLVLLIVLVMLALSIIWGLVCGFVDVIFLWGSSFCRHCRNAAQISRLSSLVSEIPSDRSSAVGSERLLQQRDTIDSSTTPDNAVDNTLTVEVKSQTTAGVLRILPLNIPSKLFHKFRFFAFISGNAVRSVRLTTSADV